MRGCSKAIITGNLTRDPELRTTPNGASVCSFSVAVNRIYRGTDGQNKEEVSYIDCVAWGKLGEVIAQYAKRGTGVLVSGRLSQRSFEGKDGVKRSRTEIVAEDFNFISSTSRDGSGSTGYATGSSYGTSTPSAASAAPATPSDPADLADIPDEIPEGDIDLNDVPF